jgi:hypothetical protein
MITIYALALAVTLILEVPIVAAFYPKQRLRMGIACAIATTATNLALNLTLTRSQLGWDATLVTGESLALVLEAAVYAYVAQRDERGWPRALAASAAANLASYGAGLLLF